MVWLGLIDNPSLSSCQQVVSEHPYGKELDCRLHGNDGLKAFSGKTVKPMINPPLTKGGHEGIPEKKGGARGDLSL